MEFVAKSTKLETASAGTSFLMKEAVGEAGEAGIGINYSEYPEPYIIVILTQL